MLYNKNYFLKIFSSDRMEKYYSLYPNNEALAISHYKCNIQLSEAMYVPISVLEVALRNALAYELISMTGRQDWYEVIAESPQLSKLNHYIKQAINQISGRHEQVTPSKVVAELTLGFWVALFNMEFEMILWKNLRRAFPFMPKKLRQRKNVSGPLNRFRRFRNRVFHNESICWNIDRVAEIHSEMIEIMGWINKDIPSWLSQLDRFDSVKKQIQSTMQWE